MAKRTSERKQEILDAALDEFVEKGTDGVRMQSIADKVGVTKAMIHYYFDTKEKLFQKVFGEACKMLFGDLMKILETDVPLFHKIDQFTNQALKRFHTYPALAGFIVTELNYNSEETAKLLWEKIDFNRTIFERQLDTAASNYEIARVSSQHVLANILSLCLFPCTGRTFMQELLLIDGQQEYKEFLDQRSGIISDTIINWLAS